MQHQYIVQLVLHNHSRPTITMPIHNAIDHDVKSLIFRQRLIIAKYFPTWNLGYALLQGHRVARASPRRRHCGVDQIVFYWHYRVLYGHLNNLEAGNDFYIRKLQDGQGKANEFGRTWTTLFIQPLYNSLHLLSLTPKNTYYTCYQASLQYTSKVSWESTKSQGLYSAPISTQSDCPMQAYSTSHIDSIHIGINLGVVIFLRPGHIDNEQIDQNPL